MLIQTVCATDAAAEVLVTVLFAVTEMVPVAVMTPQPPVNGML